MKFCTLLLFFALSAINSCVAQSNSQIADNSNLQTIITPPKTVGDYQAQLKSIQSERLKLAAEYRNTTDKKSVLARAEKLFITSIDTQIFPFWYGTEWDFYGTTETPKTGKIACGYFVTTVLRDAGVTLQRVSLAQQASENIVKSLTDESHIKRFRNVEISKFVNEINNSGTGLYVVGLDNHVGFILNDGTEIYFVHSSYGEPCEVIKEKAISSPILSGSKYRVIGKISGDEKLILKWLNQTAIPTLR